MHPIRRPIIDAVIRTGGKQYRVHEGSLLNVATLDAAAGSVVELSDVLLVSDGDRVTVGSPNVADAVVVAEVVDHGRAKKVISFKFKAKTRYRRKRGHRQPFTRLAVKEIRIGPPAAATGARRGRAQAAATTPAGSEASPAAEEAAPAAPRRRRRTAASETSEQE